jgi:predicted amidohydrolase
MTPWYSAYPGLSGRLDEIRVMVDQMAEQAQKRYGRGLDLALFSECALTAGKPGKATDVAIAIDDEILGPLRAMARTHHCYLALGGVFRDPGDAERITNGVLILDREGRLVGTYAKVHAVLDNRPDSTGPAVLEGGVQPGAEYPVFDLDFGRVGVQICYDIEFPEGWKRLGDQGAEVVLWATQSPQYTRPAMYAATREYWVASSTFRSHASFFEPGTGLVAATIHEPDRTLVHEVDLSYLILPWTDRLRDGQAFREVFGDRVGFRYSETEDRGVFWSNDPNMTIQQMARQLGLDESSNSQQARARAAQDQIRGGPAGSTRP